MVNVFQRTSKFDEPIDKVLKEMDDILTDADEYERKLTHLERLTKLQNEERGARVSPDTLAVVAGNLLGILTIVAYEQKHVMVSKALGLILRSKQTNV